MRGEERVRPGGERRGVGIRLEELEPAVGGLERQDGGMGGVARLLEGRAGRRRPPRAPLPERAAPRCARRTPRESGPTPRERRPRAGPRGTRGRRPPRPSGVAARSARGRWPSAGASSPPRSAPPPSRPPPARPPTPRAAAPPRARTRRRGRAPRGEPFPSGLPPPRCHRADHAGAKTSRRCFEEWRDASRSPQHRTSWGRSATAARRASCSSDPCRRPCSCPSRIRCSGSHSCTARGCRSRCSRRSACSPLPGTSASRSRCLAPARCSRPPGSRASTARSPGRPARSPSPDTTGRTAPR